MKNSSKALFLSLIALVFVLGVSSCGKANLRKDLDGSWTLNTVTVNGQDIYAAMGASITGTWIFDKKSKTCSITMTMSYPGTPDQTSSDNVTYTVEDKETIMLDGDLTQVKSVSSSALVLSYTDGTDVTEYHFTR